jgi:hypothetical protein
MPHAPRLLGLCLLFACERKAPGPDECQAFAYRALGIRQTQDLMVRGAMEKAEDLTRDCLTTPFDRTLLRCVEETGRARYCLDDFQNRRQLALRRGVTRSR